MRNFLVGLASLVAATTAATTVAHADPLSVDATGDAPARSSYVQGGLVAGANDGYLTAGGTAEIGTHAAPNVWVHASLAQGVASELFGSGSGSYTQVRAGADVMGCSANGALCAFLGADLGIQHVQWTGYQDSFFSDSPSDGPTMTYDRNRMIGVGRLGLDIGGTHLRWRPSIEASMSNDGINGANVMQSVAYRF